MTTRKLRRPQNARHWSEDVQIWLESAEPGKYALSHHRYFNVLSSANEVLGKLVANDNYVERVPIARGSRIGKDLAPRTVWSYEPGKGPGELGRFATAGEAVDALLAHRLSENS